MALTSLGDGSRYFLMRKQGAALRQQLSTLTRELSSGRVSDPVAALGRDTARLSTNRSDHAAAEAYRQATIETGQTLALMQSALGEVDATREALAGQFVLLGDAAAPGALSNAGASAAQGFESAAAALNQRMGGRAMFAGRDSGGVALAPARDMLDAIRAGLSPSADAGEIRAAVERYFHAPGGGFESDGYRGDAAGHAERRLGPDERVRLPVRADDRGLRDVLGALALATLAGEAETLDVSARASLIREAGTALLSAAQALAEARAGIGAAEAATEAAGARHAARATALGIMQNQMTAADPYETATALQEVQLQLETHYTLTARLSELSLTRYLR